MDPGIQAEIENTIASILSLTTALDAITDAATRQVYQSIIDTMRQALQRRIAALVAAGEGPSARGVLARALAQIGVHVGKASGAQGGVGGGLLGGFAKLAGAMISAVAIVLTSPSDIGGVDTKVVSEFILRVGETCYRLVFYKTKYTAELIWGPVRLRWEEVTCPPAEATVQP